MSKNISSELCVGIEPTYLEYKSSTSPFMFTEPINVGGRNKKPESCESGFLFICVSFNSNYFIPEFLCAVV